MPTNSESSSPALQTQLFDSTPAAARCGQTVTVPILGCGHIISFKNTKMLLRGKYVPDPSAKGGVRQVRPPMLMTDPKKQVRMKAYQDAIESALRSAYQTDVAGMQTAPSLQRWIASCVFLDDSLDWIPESDGYRTERVDAGHEGIIVEITRLPDQVT